MRALVARLDSAGDVLLAGPAVRAVAHHADEVTVLCGPRGRAAAELLPGVDRVVEWPCPWIDATPPAATRESVDALVDELAALQLDAAVVLTSFHQSALPTALLLRMAGVPHVGALSEDYPGSLLDVRHRGLPDGLHEAQRALSTAAACGFTPAPGDDDRLAVRYDPALAPAELPDRYVVVHPGASVPARAWSPQRNAEAVEALVAADRHVVVTGGPDETALTAQVAGRPRPEVLDLGGRLSLEALAAVLARAACVVVGNTGPAHLAAAVGVPVVSLFAPTVPAERWRPHRVAQRLLHEPVPCAGCRAKDCPVPGHPCLEPIRAAHVVAAVEALAPTPHLEVAAA
ncbi:glycosyltransferase family 9 protein [Conexibacter sp. SYSU D00693]|uniref:glycosyltransferase family 9 protein n=1 Tax=Conexibacter sp. SYSU D00693 TaxID=2812560 RepID=UPI00196B88EA|nr:glycosyltransferase family 9 protein [Conexibacter sp. SYSU D00693]